MTLGPLEYTVIGFRKGTFDGSIARAIGKVVDQNIIRIVDIVFIDTDAQGNTVVLEIDAKEDPAFESFAPILQNRMGLFTPEDIETLAESLPPETSALAILFEHHWAVDIKDAVGNAGGFLVARAVIPPEVLEEVSAELEASTATPA
ncbi:MAG TPA: DUF6325 family protein [Candidatus Limnocylindrales bacterium]|nr:DUF6325 family protein [Candidatus Limnocylindrales bacterium]